MGLYFGGFIIVNIFASEIWGAYFGGGGGMRGLIIGILRYNIRSSNFCEFAIALTSKFPMKSLFAKIDSKCNVEKLVFFV